MLVRVSRRTPCSRSARPRGTSTRTRSSAASRSLRRSGRGLNKVRECNSANKNEAVEYKQANPVDSREVPATSPLACKAGTKGSSGTAAAANSLGPTLSGTALPPQHQPALFAWVVGGGKNLTPVRRCGLGGPHPRTSRGWRRFCQRVGHTGVSKHAEMAAIAALQPEALQQRRRLTLVVVRLRRGLRCTEEAVPPPTPPELDADAIGAPVPPPPPPPALDGGDLVELGLARPCDECSKIICALGCFRRIVYSTDDGHLASLAPEDLLQQCTPSSGKRLQQKRVEVAGAGPERRRGPRGTSGRGVAGAARSEAR